MELTINILLAVVAVIYLIFVVKRDLQMLQQNSYRNERYEKWLGMNSEYTSIARLSDIAIILLLLSKLGESYYVVAIAVIALAIKTVILARKRYKHALVFTKRVWRLYITEMVLLVAIAAVCALGRKDVYDFGLVTLFFAAFSYIVVLVVNWLMKPVENRINKYYYDDAQRILREKPDMRIIGITGSYGKTSTKNYLNRILSEQFSVLMTPGSYNTPMGVIRTVREMLQPYNEVFIVEMGAKNIGDIKEICDLVHPEMGIITAVGAQHLESFKTIENVQRTKFELVDALPAEGFAVLNNDFPFVANRRVDNVEAKRYAVGEEVEGDYHAVNITYSAAGTTFTVKGEGKEIELTTKLLGECNISNLMGAVIIAMKLGVPDDKIKYAVSKIAQVEHRLNLKRTAGGLTIIDDAFNSNPDGSRMALDVLGNMTQGKRIVITPGMIELGDKQKFYNEKFGEHIAETCDEAIIVGQYNREAILEGIKKNKMPESNVHVVDSFNEAQALLMKMAKAGDTVLYENDLPDTFK